ncbi:MAG: SUF system NifU family Fe-S cluster assembly protein [candidate division Zixibacteria bacterium RBG_16_53_22]|nr:MAG: SUF system NifU family Fe-S cluster assembly protein [candidate division Zixibacteria bacterium RBG_16_53_22]
MPEPLDELYRDIIMDHYRYPRGRKKLENADMRNEGQNPVCGDEIELSLKLDDGRVDEVSVECMGCAISVASGSMLVDAIKGKSLQEVRRIAAAVKAILKGEPLPEEVEMGDLEALAGVKNFPVRIKCALLSWTTLIDGIEALEEGVVANVTSTE